MDCGSLWDFYLQLQNMYSEFLSSGDWESLMVVVWAMMETASTLARYGC